MKKILLNFISNILRYKSYPKISEIKYRSKISTFKVTISIYFQSRSFSGVFSGRVEMLSDRAEGEIRNFSTRPRKNPENDRDEIINTCKLFFMLS